MKEVRLLGLDKKRSQIITAGVPRALAQKATALGTIRDADFKKSIASFQGGIKWKKQGKSVMTVGDAKDTETNMAAAFRKAGIEDRKSVKGAGALEDAAQDGLADEEKNGYTERRSDRPERRRALQQGEMINEFRDKINWREYYRRITDGKYDPDRFEDGEKAAMLLNGQMLRLQMQKNGEWSVIGMEEYHDDPMEYGRAETIGKDGTAQVRGERDDNGFDRTQGRSVAVPADRGASGQRSDGAGHGEGGTAVSSVTQGSERSDSLKGGNVFELQRENEEPSPHS